MIIWINTAKVLTISPYAFVLPLSVNVGKRGFAISVIIIWMRYYVCFGVLKQFKSFLHCSRLLVIESVIAIVQSHNLMIIWALATVQYSLVDSLCQFMSFHIIPQIGVLDAIAHHSPNNTSTSNSPQLSLYFGNFIPLL